MQTSHILSRLAQAEWREVNPHFRDDYRIAWITILNAACGIPEPEVGATYAVLGLHPLKVWPAIVARRKALLGPLYEDFYPTLDARPVPAASHGRVVAPAGELAIAPALPFQKKPVQSVRIAARRAA
jgi:hypothetical protein